MNKVGHIKRNSGKSQKLGVMFPIKKTETQENLDSHNSNLTQSEKLAENGNFDSAFSGHHGPVKDPFKLIKPAVKNDT